MKCVTVFDMETITAVLAAITLIVACLGLRMWKVQLRGTKQYEVAFVLKTEILQTIEIIKGSFKLVNTYIYPKKRTTRSIQYITNKLKLNLDLLKSKRDLVEKAIINAEVVLKNMPTESRVILDWIDDVIKNYAHVIKMLPTLDLDSNFSEDKENFSNDNLSTLILLMRSYIRVIKD